jgi:hypothetical protein
MHPYDLIYHQACLGGVDEPPSQLFARANALLPGESVDDSTEEGIKSVSPLTALVTSI